MKLEWPGDMTQLTRRLPGILRGPTLIQHTGGGGGVRKVKVILSYIMSFLKESLE